MEKNPFSTLYNVLVMRLDNQRDPLLQRATLTTDLHDAFSLVHRFLESWRLPCIAAVRPDEQSITGLTLLAVRSTAPINWLHSMLGCGEVMAEYFRYAGLHFTEDSRSAVATPRNWPPHTHRPSEYATNPPPHTG